MRAHPEEAKVGSQVQLVLRKLNPRRPRPFKNGNDLVFVVFSSVKSLYQDPPVGVPCLEAYR